VGDQVVEGAAVELAGQTAGRRHGEQGRKQMGERVAKGRVHRG
jgi:hypothetical protein